MKKTKHALAALLAAVALMLSLTGCSFKDLMLYLYGGDDFTTSDTPDYASWDGDNGVTVVYDKNKWQQPTMAQDDTLSVTGGNRLGYTVVRCRSRTSTRIFWHSPARSWKKPPAR